MEEYNGLKVYSGETPSRDALSNKLKKENAKVVELIDCLVKQSNKFATKYYYVERLAARFESGKIVTYRVMRNGAIQPDNGFAQDFKRLVLLENTEAK